MNADGQAIRGLIASWAHASETGDLAALESLMDPEVLFLTPGNEPMTHDAFRARFESAIKAVRIECRPEVREVEVSGDLAYAWSWLEVKMQPASGEAIERKGYVLSVFKRRPGEHWKLWRDANLLLS